MKTSILIPIKSFSNAKTRLNISQTKTHQLCEIMLKEMLDTISKCRLIDKTILISKEKSALRIGEKFDCTEIIDNEETGVNDAISLADKFLTENDFTHSIILPQDIPLVLPEDIENLLKFCKNDTAIIVPSRHFDGTNALVRSTKYQMETRYDEGSYRFQFEPMKKHKIRYSLALIHRIMIDIDSIYDVNYALKQKIKAAFSEEMKKVIFS